MTVNDDYADEWITAADAARRFDTLATSVTRLARQGRIRAHRGSEARQWLISASDLASWYGRTRDAREAPDARPSASSVYVVLVDPDARPTRVKVGATTDLDARLSSFRTVAPEARVLASYSVPTRCEGYALTLAEALAEAAQSEVFDFTETTLGAYLGHLDHAFSPLSEAEAEAEAEAETETETETR